MCTAVAHYWSFREPQRNNQAKLALRDTPMSPKVPTGGNSIMIKQLTSVATIIAVAGFTSACKSSHYASNDPCGNQRTAYSSTSYEASGAEAQPMQSQQSGQFSQSSQGGNEVAIPLYEERVNVGKQEIPSQVQLRKYTTTETVNVPVELRHEHVVIERAPAGAATGSSQGQAFQDQSFTVQLQNEQPIVQKQTVQTGSVIARKDSQSQQINIQQQVRKEDVTVDKSGNPNVEIRGNFNEAAGAQAPQQQDQQWQQQQQQQQNDQLQSPRDKQQ
jgi:uncharacterized protein (TIGR02271 family)